VNSYTSFKATSADLQRAYDGPVAADGRHGDFQNRGCLFWLLRKGSVEIQVIGQTYRATRGTIVLAGSRARRQDFSDDSEILSINYYWTEPDGRPFFDQLEPWLADAAAHPELKARAEAVVQRVCSQFGNPSSMIPSRQTDTPAFMEVESAFLAWLAEVARVLEAAGVPRSRDRAQDERVQRAQTLLSEAPLDQKPDYNAIAHLSGLSRPHLERLYRREFHLSPSAHFENRRLEHAQRELARKGTRIKEVSLQLGFKHLSQFSVWFSKNEGVSPREYQNAVKS
jgi:AraC-like DNA-binding protein